MSPREGTSWRDGLEHPLIAAVECAIERFRADQRYELKHGRLSDTLEGLRQIGIRSKKLKKAFTKLSPVGRAAFADANMRRITPFSRWEIGVLREQLKQTSKLAQSAAALLLEMHSPMPDEEQGQGSNSAVGRDSDLRALKAEHDRSYVPFAFRSPKDKLGVAVVIAYLRHEQAFDPLRRGAGRVLETFLTNVWLEISPDEPTSWKRIVHARRALVDLVRDDVCADEVWQEVQEKRRASSPK